MASSWPGSSETPYLRVMAKDTEKVELFALPSAVPIGTITLTSCYNISMKVLYMTYEELLSDMLARKGGVLTARDASDANIPKKVFYRFIQENELEKASHGVYVSPDEIPDELYLLQQRYPKIIFSHQTALWLHDLAEREPLPISLTVDSNYNAGSLSDQGVKIYYVKPDWYDMGACEVKSPGGHLVRAYDKERTLCDMIRRKKATDPAAYRYALRHYAASPEKNLLNLSEYAQRMGIERQVAQAMEVLL